MQADFALTFTDELNAIRHAITSIQRLQEETYETIRSLDNRFDNLDQHHTDLNRGLKQIEEVNNI